MTRFIEKKWLNEFSVAPIIDEKGARIIHFHCSLCSKSFYEADDLWGQSLKFNSFLGHWKLIF